MKLTRVLGPGDQPRTHAAQMSMKLDATKSEMKFHRLLDVSDELLADVMDIYQHSFPYHDQIPVSFFLRYLHNPNTEENSRYHFYCMTCDGDAVGFAFFEVGEDVDLLGRPGYLWYLGIKQDQRGKGYGTGLYEFVHRIVKHYGCRALTYEIELADLVRVQGGEESAQIALRRREWYQKRGACAISGIHYQYAGGGTWEVIVHCFEPLTAEEAIKLVMPTLDGKHSVTGKVKLDCLADLLT